MDMDKKLFLKNIIKYCFPSVFSAIVGLAAIPIISKVYPTSDYGRINLFYSLGNMILYIVLLGLDSAYIRFYFEPPFKLENRHFFSMAFFTGFLNTVVVTFLVLFCFSNKISFYLFGEYRPMLIVAMGVYIIGLIIFRLLSIETRMEGRALLFNIQQILLIFTNRVSFVIVAIWSTRYNYSILAISLSSFALGIAFLFYQKKVLIHIPPRMEKEEIKYILSFAIPLMPTTVMTWLNNSVAKMVLSGYGAFGIVGILSIATSLANVFSLIPAAFNTYWSPFMYENYNKEQDFISKVHNYIVILSIIITMGIFCFQDFLYNFVNGDYKISQPYFMLIMLAPIQSLLCETTSYGINLTNKTIYNLYISIVAVLFNLFASYILYPLVGIWGVVIGIAGSALIQLFLKTIIGQGLYRSIESDAKTYFGYIIIILICISNVYMYRFLGMRVIETIFILALLACVYMSDIRRILTILGIRGH